MRSSIVIFFSVFLFACVEPPGGNAEINKATEISSTPEMRLFGITCNRASVTSCMLAARTVCQKETTPRVIEEKPFGGFVKGAPAHLIEVAFICQKKN
jgi:hypothetical protein